jgi:hypothetical protein
MARLAALVALALLVSVSAGPAVQPLGDNLAGLLVPGLSRAVRRATLAAMQEAYGGPLGWDYACQLPSPHALHVSSPSPPSSLLLQ